MEKILSTIGTLLMICVSAGASGETWYVDGKVAVSGDGTSWETALQTIQEGIDAALEGDTVIVAEGTYVENILFDGKNIILTSTDPLDPAVVANTIIDGDQAGYVVTFSGTENETCVLSGFTVRNGFGDWRVSGGGICGGTRESPTGATVENNVITDNSANQGGGLVYCAGAVQSNVITDNSASRGGGLYACDGTIRSNTISGNSVQGPGGGLRECHGTIQNNVITGNSALVESGGGLSYCHGTIENNLIAANSAKESGGGLSDCYGTIQNNTITANSGSNFGGLSGCGGTIRNCIICANSAPGDPSQLGQSATPTYSCIEGWTGGGKGNIRPKGKDPGFVDAAGGNYRLGATSPCIDAGADYHWFVWPQRDMDANCRLVGKRMDMGCYEFGTSVDSDGDLLSDTDEATKGCNPLMGDTDGDGLRDGLEILRGSDPVAPTPPRSVHVPGDVTTIQKPLCLSVNGDEIIVSPGTYPDNLDFCGAEVVLRSTNPSSAQIVGSTVIDGGGLGPAVRFSGFEGPGCVLSGFTIRNGTGELGRGISGGTPVNRTHATIQNNVITGNPGAGVYGCDGTIQNNVITANPWGGGLYDCDGTIQNNVITANNAQAGGGLYGCDGLIRNNIIAANHAYDGGGLRYCTGTIQNNAITGNSAAYGGGLSGCLGTIENNTIAGNSANEGSGGGLYGCAGTIRNCIIWGNAAPSDPQLCVSSEPSYSCIQGWTGGGEGNIGSDPLFVKAAPADCHLKSGSPCIDKGMNEDSMWKAVDLDGNPRIWRGNLSWTIDMGAYEYGASDFRVAGVVKETTGQAQITWNSRPDDNYVVWACRDLLAGPWTEEATIASQGDSTEWTDHETTSMCKFYKIEMR